MKNKDNEVHEGYTHVPGTNVFVRDCRSKGRFSDIVRTTEEILNPRVTCGFSRSTDEIHAPVGMAEPSSFIEKRLDTEGD